MSPSRNAPAMLEGQVFQFVRQSKPVQPGSVLRTARLGLARQSVNLRGLEQPCDLRGAQRDSRPLAGLDEVAVRLALIWGESASN